MQQALRVGKRAHAETGIDRAGQSVVTAALELAAGHLDGDLAAARRWWSAPARWARSAWPRCPGWAPGRSPSPTGAPTGPSGSPSRTARPPRRSTELADALSTVDIVVAATASTEPVLTRAVVTAALARRDAGAGARWSCSTWPSRATSSPASPSCPASRWSTSTGLAALLADGPARRRRRRRRADRRRRGGGVPHLAARRRRGADRGRPARPRRRGGHRRAAPAGPAPPRPHRRPARRGGPHRAPGGAAAAAPADRAGPPARRRARRRPVRRAAAGAVRPRGAADLAGRHRPGRADPDLGLAFPAPTRVRSRRRRPTPPTGGAR